MQGSGPDRGGGSLACVRACVYTPNFIIVFISTVVRDIHFFLVLVLVCRSGLLKEVVAAAVASQK